MVMPVKQTATSKTFFSPEQIATARAAAAETPVEDAENPSTRSEDWDNAIVSHSYQELREKLTERRQIRGHFNGVPKGIRTPVTRRERAVSWASRRWGQWM
jgi:hypothetical protein